MRWLSRRVSWSTARGHGRLAGGPGVLARPARPADRPHRVQGHLAGAVADASSGPRSPAWRWRPTPRRACSPPPASSGGSTRGSVDIREPAAVRAVVAERQPEIVLHLAAQALVRRSYADPVGTYATNVMGTVHVLEAARERRVGVEPCVVVTSDKCYENREWWWPYREDDALGGHDPYSSSKAGAELVTSAWRRSFLAGRTPPVGVASARQATSSAAATGRRIDSCPTACAASRPESPWSSATRRPVRPWQHVLEPLAGYLDARRAAGRRARRASARRGTSGRRPTTPVRCRGWSSGWPSCGVTVPGGSTTGRAAARGRAAAGRRVQGPGPARAGRRGCALDEALAWTVEWYRALREPVPTRRRSRIEQIERYRDPRDRRDALSGT